MARHKDAPTPNTDECVFPPILLASVLPDLMFKRDEQGERDVRRYLEWQARDEKVVHTERVTTEFVLGRRVEAWDVHTDRGRWWVLTAPMNLYSQEHFPSIDYVISLHVGLAARIMSEPDPGVPEIEQALMASAWRRWEQATEAMEAAEEAEDFQAVGMRCRECLVAMVREVADPDMVPPGEAAPQRSNFVGWFELIANHVARGESAQYVRGYLKAIAKSGWQLVNWLTHAAGATQADAVLAVEATQHILGTFGPAIFRHTRGIPDRCQHCGSYRIGLWSLNAGGTESAPRCEVCGTFLVFATEEQGAAPARAG
jgi:hypothetical protein